MSMEHCHSHIATALFIGTGIITFCSSLEHNFNAGKFHRITSTEDQISRWLPSKSLKLEQQPVHAISTDSSHSLSVLSALLQVDLSRYQRNGLKSVSAPIQMQKCFLGFFFFKKKQTNLYPMHFAMVKIKWLREICN